jgi:hypothetical protein
MIIFRACWSEQVRCVSVPQCDYMFGHDRIEVMEKYNIVIVYKKQTYGGRCGCGGDLDGCLAVCLERIDLRTVAQNLAEQL